MTNSVGVPFDSHAMDAVQTSTVSNDFKFNKPKGKSDAICSHCGYSGHLTNKCFQLIGFPPNWKGPQGKRSLNSPSIGSTTSLSPNVINASSLDPISNIPFMMFCQEQIYNLTLANRISSSTLNQDSTMNTASTSTSCNHFTSLCPHNSLISPHLPGSLILEQQII